MMGMGQKCGPALAAGNAVVAKPPEIAPFGMLRFAELALEARTAAGRAQRRRRRRGRPAPPSSGHPGVDKLSFTGGSATARSIMESAARHLTPLALELGGKSPNIVFPDADLDGAATMAALVGTALLSGQGCALPTPALCSRRRVRRSARPAPRHTRTLPVGDPLDPASVVGPVVTESALERILAVIDRATADGATLLTGGTRLGGDLAPGWFVAPTVFGDVDHRSDLARNEVFGPVLAVLRFDSEDEVLAQANDSAYGLAAYLHTADSRRIGRFVRRTRGRDGRRERQGDGVARHTVRRLQAERVRP